MENQQKIESVKQKDYWKLVYKNFLHFSYFGMFLFLVSLIIQIAKVGPYQQLTMVGSLEILVITIIWFIISQLFKKHHKSSITVGYIFLAILTVFCLFPINLIGLLIDGYLFYLVYKASKNLPQLSNIDN